MKPVNFKGQTGALRKPDGMTDEECGALPFKKSTYLGLQTAIAATGRPYKPLKSIEESIQRANSHKVVYMDKTYADCLYIRATFKLNFWKRLVHLFSPEMKIETEVYCERIMPKNAAVTKVTTYSFIDIIKRKFQRRQGAVLCMIEETQRLPYDKMHDFIADHEIESIEWFAERFAINFNEAKELIIASGGSKNEFRTEYNRIFKTGEEK